MAPSPGSPTSRTLERFLHELDLWIDREPKLGDLRLPVLAWIQGRMDNPYVGVRREEQIDNVWFGAIPGTETVDGEVAVGSYFVFESKKLVRCNSFSLLSPPI